MGYECITHDKSNGMSASTIFWKSEKFKMLKSEYMPFSPGESQFVTWSLFCLADDESFKFAFGETHLKAKPPNMPARVKQCKVLTEVFKAKHPFDYSRIPVFMAGDFNEEPQNEPIKDIMTKEFEDLWTLKDTQVGKAGKPHSFTTFKYREKDHGWVKHCIDFMFINRNSYFKNREVAVEKYLDPADVESEGLMNLDIGNPCPSHPSDHYSIGYQVTLEHPEWQNRQYFRLTQTMEFGKTFQEYNQIGDRGMDPFCNDINNNQNLYGLLNGGWQRDTYARDVSTTMRINPDMTCHLTNKHEKVDKHLYEDQEEPNGELQVTFAGTFKVEEEDDLTVKIRCDFHTKTRSNLTRDNRSVDRNL